jgi:hypothetical protein
MASVALGPIWDTLDRAMAGLAQERPVFHSEGDFRFALGSQLELIGPWQVRAERPFRRREERGYLDLLLIPREGEIRSFAVELKYATQRLDWHQPPQGEHYQLADVYDPPARIGVLGDVGRLEEAVQDGSIERGFAVLLTNNSIFWDPNLEDEAAWGEVLDLEIARMVSDGNRIDLRRLPLRAPGDFFYWVLKKGYKPYLKEYELARKRTPPDAEGMTRASDGWEGLPPAFDGSYMGRWRDFSRVTTDEGGTFRYLMVEVARNG